MTPQAQTIDQAGTPPPGPPPITTAIAEYSATAAALVDLRTRFAGIVYDVTTSDGMELAKKGRAELRGLRVALEKKRKEIKAPALERCNLIDTEAKTLEGALTELEEPIDEQIKREEERKDKIRQERFEAERVRVVALRDRISKITRIPLGAISASLEVVQSELAALVQARQDPTWPGSFDELADEAVKVRDDTIASLEEILRLKVHQADNAARIRAEEERLELERQENARQAEAQRVENERLAKVERDRIAEEDRKAKAKRDDEDRAAEAERARLRKEADDREAAAKADRDRQDREAKAERDRADQEAKEKRDAEDKRLADERAEHDRKESERKAEADRVDAAKRKKHNDEVNAKLTKLRELGPGMSRFIAVALLYREAVPDAATERLVDLCELHAKAKPAIPLAEQA